MRMSEPDGGLRPRLVPEQSREMPGDVDDEDDVEQPHGIVFDPVKHQVGPAYWQHPDGFQLRVARRIKDPDLRLRGNLLKDNFRRIEQALGRSRVIAGSMGVL